MKDNRGFTLIELLAVIVVLAVILSIAVPGITNIIKNATKSSFGSDAKMVLQAIEYEKLENELFNPLEVTKENMQETIGINSDNYSQVNVFSVGNKTRILLVGKNKWEGLTAFGTIRNITVVNTNEYGAIPPSITINGDNPVSFTAGFPYVDAGATALDDIDGDITNNIVVTSNVNPDVAGSYAVSYNVMDNAGNAALTVTRTVNVIVTIFTFDYTGDYQVFNVPFDGNYQIELWGASGSFVTDYSNKGRGAYTKGSISLEAGQVLYVYVGQTGDTVRTWKFNGGGYGGLLAGSNSGGGATDIRLSSGTWDNFDSLKSRIMVAAGGGGAGGIKGYSDAGAGGYGGALTGLDGVYCSGHGDLNQYGEGGTQTTGGTAGLNTYGGTGTNYAGSFGKGGQSESTSSNIGAGGGGGGYYGGGSGGGVQSNGNGNGGAGGSSFASGCTGCNAISEASTQENIIHSGLPSHYSGYIFNEITMTAGNASMPAPMGGVEIGHSGNGYARITLMQ